MRRLGDFTGDGGVSEEVVASGMDEICCKEEGFLGSMSKGEAEKLDDLDIEILGSEERFTTLGGLDCFRGTPNEKLVDFVIGIFARAIEGGDSGVVGAEEATRKEPTGEEPTGEAPTGEAPTGAELTGEEETGEEAMGEEAMGEEAMGE